MLSAVDARARELLLEVLDPLEAGVRVMRSRDERWAAALALATPYGGIAVHGLTVPVRVHPALSNRALRPATRELCAAVKALF